jgi:Rod binding domain-containing protein
MQIANPALPSPISEGSAHVAASPQLVKAANAFEANFLGELLKPLREDPLFGNGSGLGGDSLGSDGPSGGSMGTVGSLASDALAQAIAKRGGFGIARMVLSELAPVEETASQAAAAAATGPKCGDCAQPLTMGSQAAAALDSGSIEMLGQGSLPSPAANGTTRNAVEKTAHGKSFEEHRDGSLLMPVVRPLGHVRK